MRPLTKLIALVVLFCGPFGDAAVPAADLAAEGTDMRACVLQQDMDARWIKAASRRFAARNDAKGPFPLRLLPALLALTVAFLLARTLRRCVRPGLSGMHALGWPWQRRIVSRWGMR